MNLQVRGVVNAPAAEVWKVLGAEFTDIASWFSVVDYSKEVGEEVVPDTVVIDSNAPVIGRYTESKVIKATEVFTYYSDSEKTFEFEAIGVPRFVMSSTKNRTSVNELSPMRSEVNIEVNIEFNHVFKIILAPVMKKRMNNMFIKLIKELSEYLEKK
ncbi:MAG: SRPBCC family protein [Bacteroidia bacterium]